MTAQVRHGGCYASTLGVGGSQHWAAWREGTWSCGPDLVANAWLATRALFMLHARQLHATTSLRPGERDLTAWLVSLV